MTEFTSNPRRCRSGPCCEEQAHSERRPGPDGEQRYGAKRFFHAFPNDCDLKEMSRLQKL